MKKNFDDDEKKEVQFTRHLILRKGYKTTNLFTNHLSCIQYITNASSSSTNGNSLEIFILEKYLLIKEKFSTRYLQNMDDYCHFFLFLLGGCPFCIT